jgi:hypothetical protein
MVWCTHCGSWSDTVSIVVAGEVKLRKVSNSLKTKK